MKRLKSYFFTNTNLNSRGKYISLKDNAEPNETLFSDLLDSVVKPKVGSDYQDQADYNAVNTKDSTKFTTAENLPEVDTTGSLLTITTTAAVDTNLLRRKKYTVAVNTPVNTLDISSRVDSKLVTPANLPKFALDNSLYSQQDGQVSYYDNPITETTDAGLFTIYKLKLKALTSEMMTHLGVKLNTVLNTLRTDVDACVSDAELASAVSTLNTALGLKANKVTPTFVTGYNGTKVVVNSQGVVTSVSKASALDITNDSSVSGSTVKDALNWLKANGGGTGGASDTDGVTNLSTVAGATATDALNNLLESLSHYFVKDVVGKSNGDTLEVDKINVLTLSSDTSFTLPTPSLAYKGKVLIIVQGNGGVNRAEIFGGLQGSVIISDLSDVLIYNCVYDIGGGGNWVLISRDDSKICQIPVIVESSTHYASANENIKADALSFGANISVVIPASNSEGRVIYVYYPTGAPTAYVVNLSGGYTAVLEQGDYFLLRDNGSYWEAISTNQNTATADPAFNLSVPTGVCEGGILSINADPTKFNISDGFGYIADLYTDTDPANATITKVTWSGLTAQTVTNLATSTVSFIYINSSGSIVQGTTEPTEATLRDYIYIGQLGHSNLTSISTAISQPSVAQSPMSQLRDLWGEIGFVNAGNEISANGANLSINKSNGFLTGLGINFENAIKTPNRKNYPLQTLATIRRRTQTGGTGTNTTLDVLNYDLSGTVTTITGTKAQNQRVFLLPSGNIVIQYGQTLYNSLTDAIQGIETETFVKLENVKTGQLIAIISVTSNCTSLQDTSRARIKNVGKFGEVNVGAGSSSVSTLQQAYLNSVDPEIDTVNGAVSFKNGGANDTIDVIEVKNLANSQTFSVDGNGLIKSAQSTANTPAFFNTVKGIISATGALLGTWFQTLTAKTTPTGADTIVLNDSASSFEAKKTTLTELSIFFGSASDITTEVWGTNANYIVTNTTAKILVIEQDGTLTAPRTLTLSTLPTGSIVIIRGGASITATNTVSIASFVNGVSSYSGALTLGYQSLILYSLGSGNYTTNKPQFTETTTALSTSKYLRSSAGIGLNGVISFTPTWGTGVAEGDLNWHRSASAILARSAVGDTIPFMAFAPFTGWQNYRPTTLQYFNGQNIASGNKPTEYGSGIGYVYYWSRSYIVRCFGESTDNYLEVLIYINGAGVPSIVKVLQESSVFSITLSGGTLQFAGGNAYVCFEQVPQQTTTNLRGVYNWVYQQGGTDVRFQGNLALGSSAISSLCQLQLQSTTKGLGLPPVPTSAGLAATLAGNLRYNPTTVVPEYADGSRWVKLPKYYTQVTTQTIANTTTETSMFNDTGALGTRTIPGSSTQVGSYFRIRLDGYFDSTAGPFITVKIKMGSVVIFDTTLTGTFSPTGSQQWHVEAYFTVQSIGSGTSATVFGQGRFCYATSSSTQYNVLFTTNTAVSSGYDSTTSQVLDVTFTWNTANAANTITTTNAVIEQIN